MSNVSIGGETHPFFLHLATSYKHQERQVKILDHSPFKVLGDLVYTLFAAIRPLLCAIFESFKSRKVELMNLQKDLAQSQFKALQKVLDCPELALVEACVDRGDRKGFKSQFFEEDQVFSSKARQLARGMYVSTLKEDLKKKILREAQTSAEREAIVAIQADSPYDFLREVKKVRLLPNELIQAVSLVETESQAAQRDEMSRRLKRAGRREESVTPLVQEAQNWQDLEGFLIRNGMFGTCPEDQVFQAGLFFLRKQVGVSRDKAFLRKCYQVIEDLRFLSGEESIAKQVKELKDLAHFSPQFQKLLTRDGKENPYVFLVQELSATLEGRVPAWREFSDYGQFHLSHLQGLPHEELPRLAEAMDRCFERHQMFIRKPMVDQSFDLGHFLFGDKQVPASIGKNGNFNPATFVLTQVHLHLLSETPLENKMIAALIGMVIAYASKEEVARLTEQLRMMHKDRKRIQARLQKMTSDRPCFVPIMTQKAERLNRRELETEKEILKGLKRCRPQRNSGSYGSLIYYDSHGKKYGVFKAVDAPFTLGKKAKTKARAAIGQQDQEGFLPLPEKRQLGAMISERVAYLLDRALKTRSVPKTEILYAQGRQGSFQHFLHGYREADQLSLPAHPNKGDLNKFQRFAILDFLMGNLDRKRDNWMAKMRDNGQHFKDIKMIDNANIFPRGHLPKPRIGINAATWNQYAWKSLQLAQVPLTQKSRALIQSLTESKIESIIGKWRADLGAEDFKNYFETEEGVILKAFRDRVRVLHQFALEERPLKNLATYSHYEAIQAFLGEGIEASESRYIQPIL